VTPCNSGGTLNVFLGQEKFPSTYLISKQNKLDRYEIKIKIKKGYLSMSFANNFSGVENER
jgi:hypothetical protein